MPADSLQARSPICGAARHYLYEGSMPMGVRTFRGGIAQYRTPSGRYAVDDGCWLVLNTGEHYALEIESLTEVQSTVAFFPDGWPEMVARLYREKPELLLDDPVAIGRPVRFIEATVPRDNSVSPRLLELDRGCRGQKVENGWLEEKLHDLLADLLLSQRDHRRRAEKLPAARAATREELYRRVCRGRDFLGAMALKAPTLSDAARAASLSPYHFQRSFKAAFGETPHEFITERRLTHARRLIESRALSAAEIAGTVGYESYSAFHAAYRRRYSSSPTGKN